MLRKRIVFMYALVLMAFGAAQPASAEINDHPLFPPDNSTSMPLMAAPEEMPPPFPHLSVLPQTLGTLKPSDIPSAAVSPPVIDESHSHDVVGIRFMTGGIGDEERAQIKAAEKDYNLKVVSADRSGAYRGATQVIIMDSKGRKLLDLDAEPVLLGSLPVGHYTLSAKTEGKTKEVSFVIRKNRQSVVDLIW